MLESSTRFLVLISLDSLQRIACVQRSPISFVATTEIGDVCVQAIQQSVGPLRWSAHLGKPLCTQKTAYIKTHKTAINRPVDHTGET